MVLSLVVLVVVAALILGMTWRIKTVDEITIEAGSEIPDVSSYIVKDKYIGEYITDINAIDRTLQGKNELIFLVKKKEYTVILNIVDTVAPIGELVDHEMWVDETLNVADFVTNIVDVAPVDLSYVNEPDFSLVGEQKVEVLLTDRNGNTSIVVATLVLNADTEAPIFTGIVDQSVFIGQAISFKRGVEVNDNKDADVDYEIDNSAVNTKKEGKYKVIYTATDTAGNIATETSYININVKPSNAISQEYVDSLADVILAQIINDDMSDKEKMWAIYKWPRYKITYTGTSDKSSWLAGAVQGMKKQSGDCFNYYAVARELMTRAGFEVIPVTRTAGYPTRHYWLLVKFNGGWYHYDASPNFKNLPYKCFLRTDEEVAEYTEIIKEQRQGYYVYDKELYPAAATEKVDQEVN